MYVFFFFQAEDGIRDVAVTGVQTCALPISRVHLREERRTIVLPNPIEIDVTPPVVESLRLSRRVFSPDGDRRADRVILKIGRATSELQSRLHLVCRLLLEKKNGQAGIRSDE